LRRRQLRVIRGKAICELLPATPWNKGDAAQWIRARVEERVGDAPAVLYAGDDVTDEDAIVALGPSAVTVAVGERPSAARFHLDDPQAVERLLDRLAARIESRMTPA
jgi:trehalose 6-phosphate phosphatase